MDSWVCPVCWRAKADPYIISCGHAFCAQCVAEIAWRNQSRRVSCPVCRGLATRCWPRVTQPGAPHSLTVMVGRLHFEVPAPVATRAHISHLFQLDPARVKLICHGKKYLSDQALQEAAAAGHTVVLLSSRTVPVGALQQCGARLWSLLVRMLLALEVTMCNVYSSLRLTQLLKLFLRSMSPMFTLPPSPDLHSSRQQQ